MYEYKIIKIHRIYDGDTITVDIDLGFNITRKEIIRLYGIDTPELRGEERDQGLVSRARLVELLEDASEITVKTLKDKTGKYGRMLGILYIPDADKSVNDILIEEGLAVPYT